MGSRSGDERTRVSGTDGEPVKDWRAELWLRISHFLAQQSPTTQDQYVSILRDYCSHLGAELGTDHAAAQIVQATEATALEYVRLCAKRRGQKSRATGETRVARSTVARRVLVLRKVYRILTGGQLAPVNPFTDFVLGEHRGGAATKRPTEAVDVELVKKIIDAPLRRAWSPVTRWKRARDRAFLALLFFGGLRRSEALSLRLKDVREVEVSGERIFCVELRRSKGREEAVVQPVAEEAREPVEELLRQRRAEGADEDDPLMGQIDAKTAYRTFLRYAQMAGAKHATPHSARATFATVLDDLGERLAVIQQAMRHRSQRATEIYIKRRHAIRDNAARRVKY